MIRVLKNRVFIIVIICGLLISVGYYLLSLRQLRIEFSNIDEVLIYKTSSLEGGAAGEPVTKIQQTDSSIKLFKGGYTLYYVGKKGYDSRYIEVNLNEDRYIKIEPDYSPDRLAELAQSELGAVKASLSAKYPRMGLYEIREGRILNKGDWYVISLTYTGPDVFNSDTLIAVLQKQNGDWILRTEPPEILLSYFKYPDIPKGVLEQANSLN